MGSVVVRLGMIGWKWYKTQGQAKAIDGEFHAMGSRHVSLGGMDLGVGTEHGDDEFTPEEVESAFSTNRTMCVCQLGISVLQMGVCAVKFHKAPLRASVNIGACVVALPLISAGLWALEHPEDEHAVSVMQVYQFFFLLRSALVTFDYAWEVDTRKRFGITNGKLVIATLVLVCILILQTLNSLLVMAVVRIMRRSRHLAVRRDSVTECSPLLPAAPQPQPQQEYAPPQPVGAAT